MSYDSVQIVDGFVFSNTKEYEKAKKELEIIDKIKGGLNLSDADSVKRTYNALVTKKYFTTPVGISFLHEMRGYLVEKMGNEGISPIYAPPRIATKVDGVNPAKYKEIKQSYNEQKNVLNKLLITVVALSVVIIGMFLIILLNDNVGYINTEEKILNKYSAWEEDLLQREKELKQKEELYKNPVIDENY